MQEFNLPDLAARVAAKYPNIQKQQIEKILADGLEEMHLGCLEQLSQGVAVGRYEHHGNLPFVLRIKVQKPRKAGLGDIPRRYGASVRLGVHYPKP